jgi:hypothetical protein
VWRCVGCFGSSVHKEKEGDRVRRGKRKKSTYCIQRRRGIPAVGTIVLRARLRSLPFMVLVFHFIYAKEGSYQSCPPKMILGAPTSFARAAMSSDARLRP